MKAYASYSDFDKVEWSLKRGDFFIYGALQMFCLLNSQMNACEPNPKTTSSDFNR